MDSNLNTLKFVNKFLDRENWEVKENANMDFSFSSLFFKGANEVIRKYLLTDIYPSEISQAHIKGDIHIHDLGMGLVGYCAGWSLPNLLLKGLKQSGLTSAPPKHLDTAVHQMVNFLGSMQNEWAGAQAFNSVDTFLAPFVRKDKMSYEEVKQAIQEFVFGVNITSRWGGQTPFTNITLDWTVPHDLEEAPIVTAGKLKDNTYGDFQEEMDLINRAFCEIMIQGDADGRPFTFPIPTYNLTEDFDWDSPNSNFLFEMTGKYGLPYFQNFINSDLNVGETRAMCCRLQLDLREFYRRMGGYFGYGSQTGSIGVVTINLPRIGFLSKDEDIFLEKLNCYMNLARDSLEKKREMVTNMVGKKLLPMTEEYLDNLKWHFSTIGLVGMHEALLNLMHQGIESAEGKKFAVRVLKFMKNEILKYQQETGNAYNLEATPAEGCSYRLARLDKQRISSIQTSGDKVPYYTNSTHLPVDYTNDLFSALKHQESLQTLYTGGTVFHAFIGEQIPSSSCRVLIQKICNNFRIPYFTITPTFSICPTHGHLEGEHENCPKCNRKTEVYSRVVGYLRPTKNWNRGKQEEFGERKEYGIS